MQIQHNFIFRRATWKNRAPVLSVWTVLKIKVASITSFNTFLRMDYFSRKVSIYVFKYKISFEVKQNQICEEAPDGPKDAPRWKDREECFARQCQRGFVAGSGVSMQTSVRFQSFLDKIFLVWNPKEWTYEFPLSGWQNGGTGECLYTLISLPFIFIRK